VERRVAVEPAGGVEFDLGEVAEKVGVVGNTIVPVGWTVVGERIVLFIICRVAVGLSMVA